MSPLLETLSPPARLALAYAPRASRGLWLGFLALDARLASVVGQAHEVVLAQIKLAWWRDRLGEPVDRWPLGEPLLAALHVWGTAASELITLVDGWEAMLADSPDPHRLAEGRAEAVAALAQGAGTELVSARSMARDWTLAELSLPIVDAVTARQRLPRAMRPLVVLHGMALRQQNGQNASLLYAIRLGILGR